MAETAPAHTPARSVRADALERATRAWDARVLGASWERAAQVAGYANAANACRAVSSVFGELPRVERDDLRRLWRERLELLWRQSVRDVHERQPGAVTAAVRVEQAAAALDGLNEPAKFSITPSDRELTEWVNAALQVAGVVPEVEEPDIFEAELVEGEAVEGAEVESAAVEAAEADTEAVNSGREGSAPPPPPREDSGSGAASPP